MKKQLVGQSISGSARMQFSGLEMLESFKDLEALVITYESFLLDQTSLADALRQLHQKDFLIPENHEELIIYPIELRLAALFFSADKLTAGETIDQTVLEFFCNLLGEKFFSFLNNLPKDVKTYKLFKSVDDHFSRLNSFPAQNQGTQFHGDSSIFTHLLEMLTFSVVEETKDVATSSWNFEHNLQSHHQTGAHNSKTAIEKELQETQKEACNTGDKEVKVEDKKVAK